MFKAGTQEQGCNLGQIDIYSKTLWENPELGQWLLDSSKALGGNKLVELIKNYSKKNGIKTKVTVGIVGYPNVGKSSIINSLIRRKGASVSSQPGHTKNL